MTQPQNTKSTHRQKEKGKEKDKSKNPFRKLLKSSKSATTKISSGKNTTDTRKDIKRILFSLTESELAVYKLDSSSNNLSSNLNIQEIIKNNKSSLLSQGKFEIYQINSILNYFICGSLTHPILPSCQFIKINLNTYIVPIKNPVRYWRLTLNSEDDEIIENFESLIRSIANFKIDLLIDFTLTSPFCTLVDTSNTNTTNSSITLKSFINTESDNKINIISNKINMNLTSILYQPIPIRPNSSSTTSMNSSILQQYVNDNSSIGTSHVGITDVVNDTNSDSGKASDIHALSESTEILNDLSETSINDNSNKDKDNSKRNNNNKRNSNNKNNDNNNDLIIDMDMNMDIDIYTDIDSDLDWDLNLDWDGNSDIRKLLDTDLDIGITKNITKKLNNDAKSINEDNDLNDIELDDDDLLCLWNNVGEGLTKRYSLSFKAYDVKMPLSISTFDKYKNNIKSVITKTESSGLLAKFLNDL
jgi:hypothetical protein